MLAGVEPVDDLHAVAEPIADLDLARRQHVALDDEDAVDAVAVLQRGGRNASAPARPAPMAMRTRANVPGLSGPSAFGTRPSKGNARVCVLTAGLEPRDRAGERRVGKGVHVNVERLPDPHPRRHPFGNFRGELQRIDLHEGHRPASAPSRIRRATTRRFCTKPSNGARIVASRSSRSASAGWPRPRRCRRGGSSRSAAPTS